MGGDTRPAVRDAAPPTGKGRRGAVVAAHALVAKDVEELTVVGGNPAKPIGKRDPDALCYSASYRPLFF